MYKADLRPYFIFLSMSEIDILPPSDDARFVDSPSSRQNLENTVLTTQNNTGTGISDDTVIISANTALDGYRLKNFYMTNSLQ